MAFVEEMMEDCRWFAPALARSIGPRGLRRYVSDRWQRAESFGFTLRGPVRTFIETSLLFGSNFDTDPQYAWAGKILRSEGAEMDRAMRIWEGTTAHQAKVTLWAQRKALFRWTFGGRPPTARSRGRFIEEALAEVHRVYPEKAEFVGDEALRRLIDEAFTEGERCGLSEPAEYAIVVALFLVLGHGCSHDPLFPPMMEAFQISASSSAERAELLRAAAMLLLREQLTMSS
jgi:hypothetical protein